MDAIPQYKNLFDFFAAWFPDADLEGFTSEEEVVKKYREVTPPRVVEAALSELNAMLAMDEVPLDRIGEQAWRDFDTQEEAREWLNMIRAVLAAGVR